MPKNVNKYDRVEWIHPGNWTYRNIFLAKSLRIAQTLLYCIVSIIYV